MGWWSRYYCDGGGGVGAGSASLPLWGVIASRENGAMAVQVFPVKGRPPRRGWARRIVAGVGLAAGGVAAGAVAAGYFVASAVTRPGQPTPRDEYTFSPFEIGIPYEDITFMPEHGDHYVRGWWLLRPESQRVVIACTGYRARRADLLGVSAALWRAGNNVLLFDFHGHGFGLGAPVTLAFREIDDFLGALDYARRRVPGVRIGVIGYSMGAAVAIMGAARRPDVRAVVADSSFATHGAILRHRISQVTQLPSAPSAAVATLADYFLLWKAGYRGRDVEPLRDVAGIAPRPLFIIHATGDDYIPVQDAYQLYDAASEPKELWVGEGTSHCGMYFFDRALYCRRVTDFFATHLDADADRLPRLHEASMPARHKPQRYNTYPG